MRPDSDKFRLGPICEMSAAFGRIWAKIHPGLDTFAPDVRQRWPGFGHLRQNRRNLSFRLTWTRCWQKCARNLPNLDELDRISPELGKIRASFSDIEPFCVTCGPESIRRESSAEVGLKTGPTFEGTVMLNREPLVVVRGPKCQRS